MKKAFWLFPVALAVSTAAVFVRRRKPQTTLEFLGV